MSYTYGSTPTSLTPVGGSWLAPLPGGVIETWILNTALTTSTHVYYDADPTLPNHHTPARIAIDYSSGTTANAQVWETATGISGFTPYLEIGSTGGAGDSQAVYTGPNGTPANVVTFDKVFIDVTSSGGGGGFLSNQDPRFTNVAFTKTEDDHVTLTFDFDEMDGALTNYVVHKKALDGTQTNSSDQGISGSSGTHTKTGAQIPILDGLSDGDQLWIEHSQSPIHIVWDADGYGGIDNPYVHKIVHWTVEPVSGQKSVVARFFGVDTGNSVDGYINALGPTINQGQPSWTHDGNIITISLPYKGNARYWISYLSGQYSPQYGPDYNTPQSSSRVSHNFW